MSNVFWMDPELCIFTEPQQGATYDDLLAVARHAEALGVDGFFRSDHYLPMGVDGRPGPTDAWTTLAGLARETERLRLGTLVSCLTFRHPAALAVSVAQVDAMSGGRVELGLGAGWFEAEHTAFGIPFPPLHRRLDLLEEQLGVVTGLWTGDGAFDGSHYRLEGSPAPPRPVQPHVPIIVGGRGPKRTPAIAARFADEFNTSFAPVSLYREQRARVEAACDAAGRDPATMSFSVALVVCCGTTEDEVLRRAAAIGRSPEDLRENGACGRVPEVVDVLGRWRDAGVSRIYLQLLDLHDLEHLDLVVDAFRSELVG